MTANAVLYLPSEQIELRDIFGEAASYQENKECFELIIDNDLVTY